MSDQIEHKAPDSIFIVNPDYDECKLTDAITERIGQAKVLADIAADGDFIDRNSFDVVNLCWALLRKIEEVEALYNYQVSMESETK